MRLITAFAVALSVLLVTALVGVVVAVPAGATAPAHSAQSDSSTTHEQVQYAQNSDMPLESTHPRQALRLSVTESGDVRWSIESYFLLEDDDDHEAFAAYANAVVSGDRDVAYDIDSFERAVSQAESATDREMTIEDAGWDTPRNESPTDVVSIQNREQLEDDNVQIGIISYSFTWTNFATVSNDRIYFGDAFVGEDGMWLPSITDGQALVIESPDGYGFDATPSGFQYSRSGSFVWIGPHQFDPGDLDTVFLRGAGAGDDDDTDDTAAIPLGLLGTVSLLVAIAVGVGGYLFALRRRQSGFPFGDRTGAGDVASDETTAETSTSDSSAGTALAFEEDDPDRIDPELLSDEERVRQLLKSNGGRMKQAMIVQETGWSNAKVSQLLSEMDENDEITKLRIGRENLITLPDVDPTEID